MHYSSLLVSISAFVGSGTLTSEKHHLNDDGLEITEFFYDAPDEIPMLSETNEILDPKSACNLDSPTPRFPASLSDCDVNSHDTPEVKTTSAEAEITPKQAKAIEVPRIIRQFDDILASDVFQEFILGPLYFVVWWLYLYLSG